MNSGVEELELASRLVVVTGASGNLGRAVVARLGEAGARVFRLDRHPPEGEGATVDLGDEGSVEAAFAKADEAGELWGVVHTVGGWRGGERASAAATFDAMWSVNVRPAFLVTRAAVRRLEKSARGGRVVTIGALTAHEGRRLTGALAYNASKAAVIMLTKALAEEGRPHGVRANCVAPGTLDTPQNRAALPDADFSRWVPLAEVAEVIVQALSPRSGLNGAVLPVPGGR